MSKNGSQSSMLFSIRNKIILCFLIPILFMIVIGVTAYQRSAQGLSDKFRESTQQTIKMAGEYMDMSCSFIEAEAKKYAFDNDLRTYYLGLSDLFSDTNTLRNNVKTNLLNSQAANNFISGIHIVTKSGIFMFTTSTGNNYDGIFEQYFEAMSADGKDVDRWVDSHNILDEQLSLKQNQYILACQVLSQASNACVVVDMKASMIQDFLSELDLGAGSIVGFVTPSGREIICENLAEGEESGLEEGETVFFGQSFFKTYSTDMADENMQGAYEVDYKGAHWLYIYDFSEITGSAVCALVPMDLITGQAEEIKIITVILVVMASVVALAVGLLIVAGIQNNMGRISKKFGEVARGNLTVLVEARGRDEFRELAGSANNMIQNTKKLVHKVSVATKQLETSARDVEAVSGVISDYSMDITQAMDEINEGMSRQSEHAQECVSKTDVLSKEIQEVSRVVEEVEKLVSETEDMINRGMEIVQVLGDRAKETTSITSKVGESIDSLRKESEIINTFVSTITEISEQTNLLSLNASIEAARAGEAGKGFAVVAEEIRKLADDSAAAAGEISNNVENITAQTMNSVDSAREAQTMVAAQMEAVDQAVDVFREMQHRMSRLIEGLREIVDSTEKADKERSSTVNAVKNISDIIETTARNTEEVQAVVSRLLESVENLNSTADNLGENMEGLMNEISVFKI